MRRTMTSDEEQVSPDSRVGDQEFQVVRSAATEVAAAPALSLPPRLLPRLPPWAEMEPLDPLSVSYTHLDVYKRQT